MRDLLRKPNTVALHRSAAPPEEISVGAPLFGLDAAPDGSLLAAVASAGVIRIKGNTTKSLADLPGINDGAGVGHGEAFAVTGGSEDSSQILPTSRKLFRVSQGWTRLVADLWAFEQAVNPDQVWHTGIGAVESNPFDVALLHGGRVLVADAAANDILLVNANVRFSSPGRGFGRSVNRPARTGQDTGKGRKRYRAAEANRSTERWGGVRTAAPVDSGREEG